MDLSTFYYSHQVSTMEEIWKRSAILQLKRKADNYAVIHDMSEEICAPVGGIDPHLAHVEVTVDDDAFVIQDL